MNLSSELNQKYSEQINKLREIQKNMSPTQFEEIMKREAIVEEFTDWAKDFITRVKQESDKTLKQSIYGTLKGNLDEMKSEYQSFNENIPKDQKEILYVENEIKAIEDIINEPDPDENINNQEEEYEYYDDEDDNNTDDYASNESYDDDEDENEIKKRINELTNENGELKQYIHELTKENKDIKLEIVNLKKEVESLKTEIKDIKRHWDQIEKKRVKKILNFVLETYNINSSDDDEIISYKKHSYQMSDSSKPIKEPVKKKESSGFKSWGTIIDDKNEGNGGSRRRKRKKVIHKDDINMESEQSEPKNIHRRSKQRHVELDQQNFDDSTSSHFKSDDEKDSSTSMDVTPQQQQELSSGFIFGSEASQTSQKDLNYGNESIPYSTQEMLENQNIPIDNSIEQFKKDSSEYKSRLSEDVDLSGID